MPTVRSPIRAIPPRHRRDRATTTAPGRRPRCRPPRNPPPVIRVPPAIRCPLPLRQCTTNPRVPLRHRRPHRPRIHPVGPRARSALRHRCPDTVASSTATKTTRKLRSIASIRIRTQWTSSTIIAIAASALRFATCPTRKVRRRQSMSAFAVRRPARGWTCRRIRA